MEELRPFEIKVGDRELALTLGMCAVALFRQKQEVTYIAADVEEDGEEATMRVFNNQETAEWMAGYSIQIGDDGSVHRPTKRLLLQFEDQEGATWQTFRECYGWNPAVIEREEPNEKEIEMWVDVNTQDLDGGLDG